MRFPTRFDDAHGVITISVTILCISTALLSPFDTWSGGGARTCGCDFSFRIIFCCADVGDKEIGGQKCELARSLRASLRAAK
jgi:hypothetical protein